MEMSSAQRADLARRLAEIRLSRFKGSRRAAYTKVGVNSATWTRAENGETVKEGSVVAIMLALWPETGGDWQRLDPPLGLERDLVAEVRSSNLSAGTQEYILRALAADQAQARDEGVKGA